METEDILISLSKLEESLKELDSAKKLVEKTVASYNSVGTKIEAYTTTLDFVSQNVTVLIETIKDNNASFTEEANHQLQDIVSSFSKSVDEIKFMMNGALERIKKETNSIEQSLSKGIEVIHNRQKSHSENLISKFSTSMDEVRDLFATQAVNALKTFENRTDKLLHNCEAINTTIKEEISEDRRVISNTKEELLRVNKEQADIISRKIDQLEKQNQGLQRWIYIIAFLIIISLCLRFV